MANNHKMAMGLQNLFSKGEKIVIEGNTRFLLEDPSALFWVEEEAGDLFFLEEGNERFIPPYVLEVATGQILFSTPPQTDKKYTLFFISPRKVVLRKVPLSSVIEEIKNSSESALSFAHLLEVWTNHLLGYFTPKESDQKIEHRLDRKEEKKIGAGEAISLQKSLLPEEKERPIWIEVIQGSGEIGGDSDLLVTKEGGPFYPFTHHIWIKAKEELTVKTAPTEELLKDSRFWDAIGGMHRLLFLIISRKREKQLQDTLAKMQKKQTVEEELYKDTTYKLGSVLNKELLIAETQEGSALFKACFIIGKELGVKISLPTTVAGTDDEAQIREISFNSSVYFRKIALKEGWWKEADQPIFAYENNQPVALIKRKGRAYIIVNPLTGRSTPLDKENAKGLSPHGYVFYEGFPKKKIKFLEFFKTCFKWNIPDGMTILFVAIAGGVLNLFLPFAMQQLFELLNFGKDLTLLAQFTMGLVIVGFGTAIFSVTKGFAITRIEGLSKNQLATSLWGRVLELPTSFFRKVSSGKLINHVEIFQTIRSSLSSNSVKLFMDNVYCFFYLAQMLFFSPKFTCIALAGIFVASVIYLFCIVVQVKLTTKSFDLGSIIQGTVVQIISGIPKIRVAGAEGRFFGIWGNLFSQKKRIDIKLQYIRALQSLVFRLFPLLLTAVLFSFAIYTFKGISHLNVGSENPSTVSVATFLGFSTAFSLFVTAALEILETLFSMSTILPYWKTTKYIIEEPIEKQEEKSAGAKLKGGIALEHVSFRYDKEGDWVLNDVSIQANPGELIAIVGPSGCGKSTIVRLLLGFEKPEQGDVLFDERSLQDFDLRSVRKQIGVVLQNAGILAGSIYENIVGAGNYSIEQIERAIKLSGFAMDLENLPMGLNTVVSMGGGSFSGGQRQRLFLARALISAPKVLILDEATSALDNKTQEFVSANLDAIDVTRVVIAHRLSTIKHADRIYVMHGGKVIETGTFQELSDKNGLFAEMLARQKL